VIGSSDPDLLERARTDRSGARGDPALAVVQATSVDQVRATVRWAHERRVPLVTRGAGSGLAGGALADGGIVLDLSRMDRILELDPQDRLAVVEPGVITAELDRAARGHGLFFAPDPASAALSTVGGNIATNAGGLRCVKYGITRDAVLALDVVLADGRLIHTGQRTIKGVAGYDLTSLFVGSEGTLGIVVGATVRLRAVPRATPTLAAAFASPEAAASACLAVDDASMLELLDDATLEVIDRAQGSDLRARGGALVIAQFDGWAAEQELQAAAEVLAPAALGLERAGDAAALVEARRLALPSIQRFGAALIEDICVPRSRLAEAFLRLREIRGETGADMYTFAHAGDGNVHPILSYDPSLPEPPMAAVDAAGRIFALALELGGTVTGEHGIGSLKREWLRRELGEDTHAVHLALKDALDPLGLLNPRKAL
jgi:glycolate oxidase